MSEAKVLVTGGTGFLGSALVRGLCREGRSVRVLDNNSRGSVEKLGECLSRIEMLEADCRDADAVDRAVNGCDVVYHLACVNGTRFFYERPDLVLSVGVQGTLNVVEACRRRQTPRLIFASSSEVYQQPVRVPTPEDEPARIPDVLNPRFSYAGVKLIGELMVFHMLRGTATATVVFRPHNVYGPDMGFEHVVPEFILRMMALQEESQGPTMDFPIQGDGAQTRSFCFIEDAVDGILRIGQAGRDRTIYHLGTQEEITIAELVRQVASLMKVDVCVRPGESPPGQTTRRCPDITRLRRLGYKPRWTLPQGLARTADWYRQWVRRNPQRWQEMKRKMCLETTGKGEVERDCTICSAG